MTVHVPILLTPIRDVLIEPFRALAESAESHVLLDCTFGGGGHTAAFLEALGAEPRLKRHKVVATDQDPGAVERGRERFAVEIAEGRLEIHHLPFSRSLEAVQGRPLLGVLADLGFSSDQLEQDERGLSFLREGPLDMRLDPSSGATCRELLQQVTEQELADLLWKYGEERFSRRIARAIVDSRRAGALPKTTTELADLIHRAVPPPARHGRIHAATRSFQALRIVVNRELEELDALLERVILELKPGGRAAIMSFHSLEDRKVKLAFRELGRPKGDGGYRLVTKKPIQPDDEEISRNTRSRSAKLRVIERL